MKLVGMLSIWLAILSLPAFADGIGFNAIPDDPFTITFNENGACTLINNGSPMACSGGLTPDPTQAGSPMVLAYVLPGSVGSGDVAVLDPGGQTSDLLRFTNRNGTGLLIFYSADSNGDLADTGLPGNAAAGISVTEDASGHFAFFSGGSQGVNNDYLGTSSVSAVPEPGTLALLATSIAGAFTLRRRRPLMAFGSWASRRRTNPNS